MKTSEYYSRLAVKLAKYSQQSRYVIVNKLFRRYGKLIGKIYTQHGHTNTALAREIYPRMVALIALIEENQ